MGKHVAGMGKTESWRKFPVRKIMKISYTEDETDVRVTLRWILGK
jgi:hypothetical protein